MIKVWVFLVIKVWVFLVAMTQCLKQIAVCSLSLEGSYTDVV